MAGTFSPTVRPVRPGAYFDFQAEAAQPTIVNALGVVGLPFTHSWGPANQIVALDQFGDFITYYGQGGTVPPAYTPGYGAVLQCFTGEGLSGRGGAGQVLAYRMVGSGGASSAVSLQNSAGTPATAVTFTAVYPGSYGNQITIAAIPTPSNPTMTTDLQVYVGGYLTETWTYTSTSISSLVAAINNAATGSAWVTATLVADGTKLNTITSPVAMVGGNDGSTIVAADWTNMMAAFGLTRFAVFAPFNLIDPSITASMLTWGQTLNSSGRRCMLVTGGALGEVAATATTRAAALNDPNFLTIGVGTFLDSTLGTLSTSQLAPRLAGIIAQRTEAMGLSFSRLAGLSMVAGPSDADILTGISNGFMTISQDSNAASPLRFEKGITTFTLKTDLTRPYAVYSNPKFLLTMQALENEITEWVESSVIGLLPVDQDTIGFVLTNIQSRMKTREADSIIQAGWTVSQSQSPPPTATDDFIAIQYTLQFTRDVEQVLNTVVVG